MAFGIPNSGDAAFGDQAEPDSVDLKILSAGHDRTGVISGCAVTAQAIPDTTVAVASGTIAVAGTRATVTSGNVTIGVGGLTQPRFDLVVADNAGTKSKVTGTEASNPVFPAIPASSVVLAAVYVPALDLVINTNQITDKRVMLRDTHLLASGTALGPDHTISGAAAGEVLRALSATTAAFDAIADADLPSTITRDTEALLQTLADAKGDIPVATGDNVWARLAAGTNRYGVVADSGEATGLKYQLGLPRIGAIVTRSTTQSINNATDTKVGFDTEVIDSDAFHDNVTDNTRLTVPTGLGGIYLLWGQVSWATNTTGFRQIRFFLNNVGMNISLAESEPGAANEQGQSLIAFYPLAAGDYLELVVHQTSTAGLNVQGYYNALAMFRLGV